MNNYLLKLDKSGSSFNLTSKVGTYLYLAPELDKGLEYNKKVDVYSLGLIYFEMLNEFKTTH